MLERLTASQLHYRIRKLPKKQRTQISAWLAASDLAEALRKTGYEKHPPNPTSMQVSFLAWLDPAPRVYASANIVVARSCIANGWARRKSIRIVITRAGRALLHLVNNRSAKQSMVRLALKSPSSRSVSLRNVESDKSDVHHR